MTKRSFGLYVSLFGFSHDVYPLYKWLIFVYISSSAVCLAENNMEKCLDKVVFVLKVKRVVRFQEYGFSMTCKPLFLVLVHDKKHLCIVKGISDCNCQLYALLRIL